MLARVGSKKIPLFSILKGGIMAEANLEQLKLKYQSVLNLMNTLKVQLKNLHIQDNKLVIRGVAQTKDDANKVWNQIKLVDKDYKLDLMAEITFLSDAPAAKAAPTARLYKVVAGDTLSKIAKKYYGNANEYMKIFEANKNILKDPNKINVGQELIIP
jgi:LysM repeat protein